MLYEYGNGLKLIQIWKCEVSKIVCGFCFFYFK